MDTYKQDTAFFTPYLLTMAIQIPVWFCMEMLWGMSMIAFGDLRPLDAIVRGAMWGVLMWITVGNLIAVIFIWRRSIEFPAANRAEFKLAVQRACRKLRFKVLSESNDHVILGPKWAIVRFSQQETRIRFIDDTANVSAPAISIGAVKKAIGRALEESNHNSLNGADGGN